MGVTNPTAAIMGTPVNQSSYSRLISLNSINDFCIFAPPTPGSTIGNTETEQVAWCIQPRNNARVIPDGTFQAVHFVKTPLYYQVQGWADLTRMNIAAGDEGGELDPHGATGDGNPVGGNVTCNATGHDVSYEEWMNYISYQQFCLRICIAENATYSAAAECQHTLDEMGCNWVMPGDYTNNSFTECDADSAYPPGTIGLFTVGQTVTPPAPYSTPASSNCITYSTVSNGIPTAALSSNAFFTWSSGMSFSNLPSSSSSGASSTGSSVVTTTDAAGSTVTSAVKASASKSGSYAIQHGSSYGPVAMAVFSAITIVAAVGVLVV
ncbi:hypothetical protein VHUM_04301 [Vanrija humicola]|uniref:Immunoreactive mannoprotein MP88 n=1 Tax=Vanrija humicola TaxID=5417 RepID=A0A7D8YVC6_VANHU|nr:hypothetical protein VHUM_04301 [Vanrija humicola]